MELILQVLYDIYRLVSSCESTRDTEYFTGFKSKSRNVPHFTHTAFFHIVLVPEVFRNGPIRHEPDIVLMGRDCKIYRSRNALCPQAQQPNVALKLFGHFVRSSCVLPSITFL